LQEKTKLSNEQTDNDGSNTQVFVYYLQRSVSMTSAIDGTASLEIVSI